jgi:acyl-CoA thioester hydrolase
VVRVEARYRAAARYDEQIVVRTRMSEAGSRRCVFSYRVERETDGQLLVSGMTEHVALNRSTGRPTRIPEPFRSLYSAAVKGE